MLKLYTSMKKTILTIFLISLIFSAKVSLAQAEQINAGVLPSVWYSAITINDQDSIKIYGAIRNNSTTSFSGTASFIVDDELNSKVNFTSEKNSLIEINSPWKATNGRHSVQIRITNINNVSTSSLISFESDNVNLSINKKITIEDVKNTAEKVALSVVDTIDKYTSVFADKIEDFKKPVSETLFPKTSTNTTSVNSVSKANDKPTGRVLGIDTTYNEGTVKKVGNTIYNKILDFLSMIVRHWIFTISIIIILVLIIKYLI